MIDCSIAVNACTTVRKITPIDKISSSAPELACFSGPIDAYKSAITGSASMNRPIPHGRPIISDILIPAFAVALSLPSCFFVNASVIAGTRLIATAVENT